MFKKNALVPVNASPMPGLEADMADLVRKQKSLQARVASTSAANVAAVAARRMLLLSDDPAPAALDEADKVCRAAADAESAAIDALAETDNRIIGLRDRIDRLRVAEQREREAKAIEVTAFQIDAAVTRMTRAAAELEAARAELAGLITPELVDLYSPPSNVVEPAGSAPAFLTRTTGYDLNGTPFVDVLDAELLAVRILGHVVAGCLPGLGITRMSDTLVLTPRGQTKVLAPVDAEVAASLLADPMRRAAEARRVPEAA